MSNKKILVVDDEQIILMMTQKVLGKTFEVVTAVNGEDALVQLEQENPDLVLLDLMMPGTDGLEVCRRIRLKSAVPVIVMTALEDRTGTVVQAAFREGANDYLNKPFSSEELLKHIDAALNPATTDE